MLLDHAHALADHTELEERRAMLATAPHIQRLEEWRTGFAENRRTIVPHFDPADAGDQARVLILMDRPSLEAVSDQGTGFVSVDNPDSIAERCWLERDAVGLREGVLLWNLIPTDNPKPTADDRTTGAKALGGVLRLLPRLQVVLLCGLTVQQTWEKHLQDRVPRAVPLKAPGVGPQALSRKAKQVELRKAFERAKRLVG